MLYQSTGTAYAPARGTARLPRTRRGATRRDRRVRAARALGADLLLAARPLPRRAVSDVDTALAARSARPGGARRWTRILAQNPSLHAYRAALRRALAIAGGAPSPYAAVVELETWFRRRSELRATTRTRTTTRGYSAARRLRDAHAARGYCQHFAGAMALMLRYLGIPARVAAGFTSGSYNSEQAALEGDRPRRARLGRGVVPRLWLASVRPDAGPRRRSTAPTARRRVGFNAAAVSAADRRRPRRCATTLGTERFDRGGEVGRGAERPDVPARHAGTTSDRTGQPAAPAASSSRSGSSPGSRLLEARTARGARFLTRDPRRSRPPVAASSASSSPTRGSTVPESATTAELGELVRQQVAYDVVPFVDAMTAARYGPPDRADEAAPPRAPRAPAHRARAAPPTHGLASARAAWSRFGRSASPTWCARDRHGSGRGAAAPPGDRALAEAGPADRRAAGARDAPAGARGAPASSARSSSRATSPSRSRSLAGDGGAWGLDVSYADQPGPDGSADAVARALAAGAEPPCLVVGADTVFGSGDVGRFAEAAQGRPAIAVRRNPPPAPPHRYAVAFDDGRRHDRPRRRPGEPVRRSAALGALGPRSSRSSATTARPTSSADAFQRAIDAGVPVAGDRDRADTGLDGSG